MPKPKRTCVAANMTWVKRKTVARRYGAWVGPSTTRRARERWEMMGKRWRREATHGLLEARRRRLEARCCELRENFERRTPGRLRRRGTDGIVRFVSFRSFGRDRDERDGDRERRAAIWCGLLLTTKATGATGGNGGWEGKRTGKVIYRSFVAVVADTDADAEETKEGRVFRAKQTMMGFPSMG